MTSISAKRADEILRKSAGVTLRTAVARILRSVDAATPADVANGLTWYGDGSALLDTLASIGGVDRQTAAAVVSHLSPRTTWQRNTAGAAAMLAAYAGPRGGESAAYAAGVSAGCISANVARAVKALEAWYVGEDSLATFGAAAHKTKAFARNLLGDTDAVTVDVWAARIALEPEWQRGADSTCEATLKRVGVYDSVALAYRIAAAKRGLSPAACQAIAWVVVRNGRAN